MNIIDKKFKNFLGELSSSLQDSIESAIDFLSPDSGAIDDDFLKMLYEVSPETHEAFKQGMSKLENQPEQDTKIKFLSGNYNDFEALSSRDEDIIVWEGDYTSSNSISISNSKIVIITGDVACNNIEVNDSYLFVNGNVNCNILFGASGNDKMTHIALNIKARAIVENGHYTLADGEIRADEIIMIHNEIKSSKEMKADRIFETSNETNNKLSSEILDDEGFFDEEKFLDKVDSNLPFKLIQ